MIYTVWALGTAAILSSVLVISAKNPIHSVLALVFTYLTTCGIMVLVNVEFLALLFMIVYVGAIAILFLFVVMMLNIKLEELKDNATRYVPIGLLIGLVFIVEVLIVLESETLTDLSNLIGTPTSYIALQNLANIQVIGHVLYTDFWMWMVISSIILLVAMIGAIVLTLHHESSHVKRQDIFGQISSHNTIYTKCSNAT